MTTTIIVGLVILVCVAGGGLYMARSGAFANFGGSSSEPKLSAREQIAEDDAGVADEKGKLERDKVAIRGILQSISGAVSSLMGNTDAYSSSLKKHEELMSKTSTIDDLRQLEMTLLSELHGIQASNAVYRKQLDEANVLIKKQQSDMERLQSDMELDSLTRIPNRGIFDKRFKEEVARAKRYKSDLSLLVCDIDNFKRINDEHGHQAGDRILRGVASQLNGQKRASDFLARYGGEEFVLILPETSLENARLVAQELRRKVAAPKYKIENVSVSLTISIGVAKFGDSDKDSKAFFGRADAALYKAKDGGRDQVVVASE